MKNVRFAIILCAVLMIAAPAMALEVEVSGHYFVEAFNHSNETLNKDEATDDYLSMEFMPSPYSKSTTTSPSPPSSPPFRIMCGAMMQTLISATNPFPQ